MGGGGGRGYVLSSFRWSSWWPARLLILLHVPPLDSDPPILALYVSAGAGPVTTEQVKVEASDGGKGGCCVVL